MGVFKRMQNNRGNTSFLWIIVLMICLYLFGFALDFINIIWIRHTALNEMSIASRVVSRQGGFHATSKPDYWDKDLVYYTKYAMSSKIRDSMDKTKATKWTMTFNGQSIGSGGNMVFDYRTPINVQMTVSYKWDYLSKMLPTNQNEQTYVFKDKVMSELVIRHGGVVQ